MKYHIFAVVFSLLSGVIFGQAKYSNEFLNIGVGARAHGMGGAVTAITNDVTSTYWNPAGLTQLKEPLQIGLMHSEWFAGVSQFDYIAFAKSINAEKGSHFALSLVRFGTDNIPNTLQLINPDGSPNYGNITSFSAADYSVAGSYATRLRNPNLSVGGSVKWCAGCSANLVARGVLAPILVCNTQKTNYALVLKHAILLELLMCGRFK